MQKGGQLAGIEHTPELAINKMQKEFDTIPAPANARRVSVAVYGFADKTGQRKTQTGVASFSMAVTQGAEVFLIKALQDVGHGQWFDVVERVGIDNLVKERTIIKQMRDAYEGKDSTPLMPLQFAGIIMEGGIIGYDSSSESGGAAYRWLGIGPQTQYSKDIVTVSLRAISVNTGKVVAAVHVTKTVYSTADSFAMLKFFSDGTQAFEAETGLTINEPGTLAVKTTIEAAVVELIKEGESKGVWEFRKAPPVVMTPTLPQPVTVTPKAEIKEVEVKKEEITAEVKKEEIKTEAKNDPLPQEEVKYLKNLAFLYAHADEGSTKRWQLTQGTKLAVKKKENGWWFAKDEYGHGGYVRESDLTEVSQGNNKK